MRLSHSPAIATRDSAFSQSSVLARDLELVSNLLELSRLDALLCFPVDASLSVWQLSTPDGVRLLDLRFDDLTAPRLDTLRTALEGYLRFRGIRLVIELGPLIPDDPVGSVVARAFQWFDGRWHEFCSVEHVNAALSLLALTTEFLQFAYSTLEPAVDLEPVRAESRPLDD